MCTDKVTSSSDRSPSLNTSQTGSPRINTSQPDSPRLNTSQTRYNPPSHTNLSNSTYSRSTSSLQQQLMPLQNDIYGQPNPSNWSQPSMRHTPPQQPIRRRCPHIPRRSCISHHSSAYLQYPDFELPPPLGICYDYDLAYNHTASLQLEVTSFADVNQSDE